MAKTPDQTPDAFGENDPLSKVNWDLLLDSIENQQCIVCIGPGVFTENGKTLEQRLAAHLRSQKDTLRIRVYDDGWYHFLDKRQWAQTWYAIKKFYETPCKNAESLFASLALIKFHLLISLTPDYKLRDAVGNVVGENNYLFSSYIKKEPFKPFAAPAPDKPLVYNLMGEIAVKASIVHTYEDMYQYLESVFDNISMSPELKETLQNAEHYLFIGMPFDRWYMHLFLHILKQNEFEGRTKYAPAQHVLSEIEEQYNITFVQTDAERFVRELYDNCLKRGLVRQTSEAFESTQPGPASAVPPVAANPEIAALKTLVKNDELDEAFSEFRDFIITTFDIEAEGKELLNFVLLEESNYNRIKKSLKKSEITQAEFEQKIRAVSFKLLEYMDDAQKLFNRMNPPN